MINNRKKPNKSNSGFIKNSRLYSNINYQSANTELKEPPALTPGAVRIVALGGIGEVGRNMTVFEFAGKLLIVDCGVLFPEEQQPGVDLILPDFTYIEDRISDVVAIIVTHGHEDHIGAIPFLLRFRSNIPVVGTKLSLALIKAKCREHNINPILQEIREEDITKHANFVCEYYAVNHSIPDAVAVAIKTAAGVILHTGDIKLDQLPLDGRITDLSGFSRLGSEEGVDLFLVDSTNAEVPGFVMPEKEIGPVLENIIAKSQGRVVVASFSSHVHRIQQVVDIAIKQNKKIVFLGRSMVRNMKIAQELEYLTLPPGVEVDMTTAATLPENRIIIITTGSQGEPLSALARMAHGEHNSITISDRDLVILASSLIPGNETSVFNLVNKLARIGARVITQQNAKIHVSGHASAGELLFLYNAVKPSNVMPIHGEWRHLRANAALAKATGVAADRIVLAEDGVIVDLIDGRAQIVGRIPVGHVYVDGLLVGDVGSATLSDRLILGEGGFISVSVAINAETGIAVTKPVLNGRGFSDNPFALDEALKLVEFQLQELARQQIINPHKIAQAIRKTVGKWVSDTYQRRPMIVPNVITLN